MSQPPISASDIQEFLDGNSDFAFEMRVLNLMREAGFTCEHAGTYIAAVTSKPRQFDIRGSKALKQGIVRLAVEVKALKPTFPALISCVARTKTESFHEVVFSANPNDYRLVPAACRSTIIIPASEPNAIAVRLSGERGIYLEDHPVGKATEQIGRDKQGKLTRGDSDIYTKWSQAIASAADLVHFATNDARAVGRSKCITFVGAVLVVPDKTLWSVQLNESGMQLGEPETANQLSFYVNKIEVAGTPMARVVYTISHLDIFTFSGFAAYLSSLPEKAPAIFWEGATCERVDHYLQNAGTMKSAI